MEEIKKIVDFIQNSEPPKINDTELPETSGVVYGYNKAMKEVLELIHEMGF